MFAIRARTQPVRRLSITALAVGLSAGLALTALPAQADQPRRQANYAAKGHLATEWQASQLVNGQMPGFAPGHPDWGLTIDTAFMIAADGSMATTLGQVKKAIAGHILDYAVYKGDTASGAMAKALLASEVLKGDPTDFGGLNLRKRVLALVAPPSAGFEAGRLRDTGKTDYSNVFGQSYGTIGLARSGAVPQDVVDYLLKQRCSAGYFRLYITAGETCDDSASAPDVDATALALQALIAAKADGAVVNQQLIKATTSWLISVQNADGSYSEDATDAAPNSNSTGLAANALVAAGHAAPRLEASGLGRGPCSSPGPMSEVDPPSRTSGRSRSTRRRSPTRSRTDSATSRSQWWRVSPQASFALVPAPLGTLTAP